MIIREAINTKAIDLSKVLPKYKVSKTIMKGGKTITFGPGEAHISYIDVLYYEGHVGMLIDDDNYIVWCK